MGFVSHQIKKWWRKSPRHSISITQLHSLFIKETNIQCSYQYFKDVTNKLTKVQSIKTGGYYARFEDVANVIVARAIHHVTKQNTICLDEKPFVPKKYGSKWLRVLKTHKGKATAKQLKCPNPFKDLVPAYLICAISSKRVVCYAILDEPLNKETFNSFVWKLISHIPDLGKRQYILFDNASFHGVLPITYEKLDVNGIAITRTPPLGCFMDPIEEFFGQVHQEFKDLFQNRITCDELITRGEFKTMIHAAVQCANATCDFEMLYNRAGLI